MKQKKRHTYRSNAERWYMLLLHLYPRGHRQEYGPLMLQTFKDHYNEIRATQGHVGITFWLDVFTDEMKSVFREQWSFMTALLGEKNMHSLVSPLRNAFFLRFTVLALFACALLFNITTLIRYPADSAHLSYGVTLLFLLMSLVGGTMWLGWRVSSAQSVSARVSGIGAGFFFGMLWVLEIGFNHLPANVATPTTTFLVDNGVWGLVAAGTFLLGAMSTRRSGQLTTGVQVGYWSGIISGLIACITGLLLVLFLMNLVVGDPHTNQEYALRGPSSGVSDIGTYFAYELLTGSVLHVLVLGIGMGTVMGVLGGLLGKGVFRLQQKERWSGSPLPLAHAAQDIEQEVNGKSWKESLWRWSLIVSLLLVLGLVGYGLVRYALFSHASSSRTGIVISICALALLSIVYGGIVIGQKRTTTASSRIAAHEGLLGGLLVGGLWIVEILLTSQAISEGIAGWFVLAPLFLLIVLFRLGASVRAAYRTKRIGTGIMTGFWIGLLTSIITNAALLLVTYLFLHTIQQHTYQLTRNWPDTDVLVGGAFAGSFAHLLLDPLLGLGLGAIGGVIGKRMAPQTEQK